MYQTRRNLLILLAVVLTAPSLAQASPTDARTALHNFLNSTSSAQGHFSQTVFDREGAVVQGQSTGTFAFLRPGMFRWEYKTPYAQTIVSNGEKLWLYDVDLAQVTVKSLSATLPSTPAAILFGKNELNDDWRVSDEPESQNLLMLRAVPKNAGAGFEFVEIGFTKVGELKQMNLHDSFGQITKLTFTNIKRTKLAPSFFTFTAPPNVDILEDTSAF